MEVKGCTDEVDGIGYFPDAPTVRGVRHLRELIKAVSQGYECFIAFVIPMTGITEVRQNAKIHQEFADVFYEAKEAGVKVAAWLPKMSLRYSYKAGFWYVV